MANTSTGFAERMGVRRRRRGLSMTTAAGLAGISPASWSRIERGLQQPTNRVVIAGIASALECSQLELTGGDPASPMASAAADVARPLVETLLDTDPELPAGDLGEPVMALGDLAERVAAAHRAATVAGVYVAPATALPALLRQAHHHLHHSPPDQREHVLRITSMGTFAAWISLKNLGRATDGWVAAERGRDLAQLIGDPVLLGLSAWSRAHSANGIGAHARAAAIAQSGIAVVDGLDAPGAAAVHGGLHLVAGLSELLAGHRDNGSQLLARARELADATGETFANGDDQHGLFFGPTNALMWQVSAATDADPEHAAALGAALVDQASVPDSRRSAHYADYARALTAVGDDARAVRALLAAERLGPERVRHSALATATARELLRRATGDDDALVGLAERLGAL